jgi:hypothetical protein
LGFFLTWLGLPTVKISAKSVTSIEQRSAGIGRGLRAMPHTVSVSHRFTPYTVPVYGSCVRPPYASVFHRKRSFTTVHVRPG